jgi:hypothetical protein
LGVTIFVSSGDNGSDCGVGDGKAHVLYPGSDPFVTCCGGTTISNVSGLNFTEDVWNDNGITGGGISDIFFPPNFPLPFWQSGANTPGSVNDGHKGRGIPDIAGNADPDSGYTLFQNGVNIGPVGGTSATAPLYAGLAALMNAGLGEPVGYLNPYLYAAPYSYVFRDINDGLSNASGGAKGYVSGPGWDACTGLGSVHGTALEYVLLGIGRTFQALSDTEVLVLGTNGNLWLEQGPFGTVPPPRQQVDGNVRTFQALSATEVLVLGTNGNLWLEQGPFGTVPPPRQQIDGNVALTNVVAHGVS